MHSFRRRAHRTSVGRRILHRLLALVGSGGLTLACFLVLPIIQAIAEGERRSTIIPTVDAAVVEPPPPPPEPEVEQQEVEEAEPPPELVEDFEPLDLSQLESALNPGLGTGGFGGLPLPSVARAGDDTLGGGPDFQIDEPPRCVYQPPPRIDNKVRKRVPGSVHVVFIVNERGRVENPIVKSSTDPVFERPALDAVAKWKFDPATRNGRPTTCRIKRTISFPRELNP